MRCPKCGLDSMVIFNNSCTKCEVPKTKFGQLGQYCENNMHLHCHSEFDYDCKCDCHEQFNNGMFSLRKPMTEKYFFMMLPNLRWVNRKTEQYQ